MKTFGRCTDTNLDLDFDLDVDLDPPSTEEAVFPGVLALKNMAVHDYVDVQVHDYVDV